MIRSPLRLVTLIALLPLATAGCADQSPERPPAVDIVAEDYEFTAPDTVSPGWMNLRMHNQGSEHHVAFLYRLPNGVTYADYEREFVAPGDSVWSAVVEGAIERSEGRKRLESVLPDWSHPDSVHFVGGVSLTAPGRIGETTLLLEPGVHVLECYVMTPEGQFHLLEGMTRRLTVVPGSSEARPPPADHELTVSNLELEGVTRMSVGEHTFAIHFAEDPKGLPVQHVHLARLDEDTDADELAEWMEYDPVMPAPVEFLGGAEHMPAGNTAYVTVDLEPGRYAWVLGVPPDQGEVETFTVE